MCLRLLLVVLAALLCGCSESKTNEPWLMPTTDSAAQPRLLAHNDQLYLSWLEKSEAGAHCLRLAVADNSERWSAEREVACGSDWFINWADRPGIAVDGSGQLWAWWLKKSADATYAYDVWFTRSGDQGMSWSEPQILHDDGTQTEHGFVSAFADSAGMNFVWLDGRETAGGGHTGHDMHGSEGAMTLRSAAIDRNGKKQAEQLLDSRVCDCCQTASVAANDSAYLLFRDRSETEIRDISYSVKQNGQWTAPKMLHEDNWLMPACPVNGPALLADGDSAWAAWFTMAGDVASIRSIRIEPEGVIPSSYQQVVSGPAVLGRVTWIRQKSGPVVLWMEERERIQTIKFAAVSAASQTHLLSTISGRGRATGVPEAANLGDTAYVVWTDVVDGQPVLSGRKLRGY